VSISCWGVLLTSISVVAPTGSAEDATLERAVCEAAELGSLNSVLRLHQSGARLQAGDNEALCRACEHGHLEVVRYLHQMGADLNARDGEPLCRACEGGHLPVVRYLHQNGVILNARDNEPICAACRGGQLEVVRYLHQNGVKLNACDNGPICAACASGQLEIVRYLHQNGIRLDARNDEPICQACAAGALEVVRYLHQNGIDVTTRDGEPLCRACESGRLPVVRYLTENGAASDARDNEPLCRAAGSGHVGVVRYLHNVGIELNARNNEALCRACENGQLDVVRYLQKCGVKLNAFNNEPLCRACDGGQLNVVRYLNEHGIKLNARNNEPICRACDAGHMEVVRYLHQNGGELTARDNEPLCRAAAAGHLELLRYIHQNGGDVSARESEPLRRAAAGKHASVVRYLHDSGAATRLLTADARRSIDQMKHEMQAAPAVDHPSAFWKGMGEVNERILGWSGEGNFKRTVNQNYFNFIPIAPDDPRMARLRRLVPDFTQNTLDRYAIEDPDRDPSSWMSFYPNYYIFKDPDGAGKRELYREYLALMYEYALRRDRSGLLATLEEPTLGNPIGVQRSGRLISQDLVNSVRERNSIIGVMEANTDAHFTLAELGAGYGRLGYVLLKTTKCRYFVFDIPPALYVSQWYLTTLFPKRRVFRFRRFDTFKEIESELSQSDLAFFTPNQLTKFPAGYFDLFANISSIHEMRRDQIKHYMELMGRTTKSALYLKQQKDYVNPVDNLVIGRNDYPLPSGWAPGVDRFDLINPGFFERIYRRGRPTDVGNPDTGSGG
jgi:putative sugar O-methyltransferase